jgi:CRP/FNR family transcriptional regulator, cyclic AMP receptor protein
MISPELIRRHPLSAGLLEDQLITLAQAADDQTVEPETVFFREGKPLNRFYLLLDGEVVILMEPPDPHAEHSLASQLSRRLPTLEIIVTSIKPGAVFGWSGLLPPHEATATAKAVTKSRVLVFDCIPIRKRFETDCHFGFLMTQKVAQITRERLRDARIESLAFTHS